MAENISIYLHTINIIVKDMERALAFYRLLGLPIPINQQSEVHVELTMPNGACVGFDIEEVILEGNPHWVTPVGQRVSFAFKCATRDEVDAIYRRMLDAGHPGLKAPWNAFWGQRYAMIQDPDGNRVDVFATQPADTPQSST